MTGSFLAGAIVTFILVFGFVWFLTRNLKGPRI